MAPFPVSQDAPAYDSVKFEWANVSTRDLFGSSMKETTHFRTMDEEDDTVPLTNSGSRGSLPLSNTGQRTSSFSWRSISSYASRPLISPPVYKPRRSHRSYSQI